VTAVDRRPTVARNFVAGDRRSVEWALEQWLDMRPPVDTVTLQGDPAYVAATALGLRDLGRLRGSSSAPFALSCELLGSPGSPAGPALAAASGAGVLRGREVGHGDLVVVVDGHDLPPAGRRVAEQAVDAAEHGGVVVVPPGVAVPRSWRAGRRLERVQVVVSTLASLMLDPAWEGTVADRGPRRLCVCGQGARLFGAAVAAGDYFLERAPEVLGPRETSHALLGHVVILEDATTPPPAWRDADTVWRETCLAAGARVIPVTVPAGPGVVMVPRRTVRAAA
jgi:hypothetical protein